MDNITPFNKLPVLVDSIGDYLLRNGKRVTIHTIVPTITLSTTAFNAKGSVWKTNEAMGNNPPYDVWHISGKHSALGAHPRDIVSKISK